jgi:hypothetical protein
MSGRCAALPIRHFLDHVEKQLAIAFFRFGQQATKLAEITGFFAGVSPSVVVGRRTLHQVRQLWRLFAFVEKLIEWDFQRARQFFQCFNSGDSVAILYTGNITTKQARSLFDVALREFLFLAHFAEAVPNNHGEIIASAYGPSKCQLPLTAGRNLFCAAQRCEDLVTDRIVNEFGEGMQAKLEHDFRPVRLHCPDGNP